MDDASTDDGGFWLSPAPADDVTVGVPANANGGEPPALRALSRPPSWRAASAPASAFSALYASSQRRAAEVLRNALGVGDDARDPDEGEAEGAGG